jgi:hypothetical protein
MPNDLTTLRSEPARSTVLTAVETLGHAIAKRWRIALPAVIVALAADIPLAHAGACPSAQPFVKIPEIVSQADKLPDGKTIHVLRGMMELTDTQVLMMTRLPATGSNGVAPGTPGAVYDCSPQTVRAFRVLPAQPLPASAGQTLPDPFPGPTLRARVGDIVQLTFLNQVDPARFPQTSETSGAAAACDLVLGSKPGQTFYPGSGANADTYPDCFHGSSTGNIHFHGTHTNPNATGDNVLLEVRPSPRDASNKPTITADTYKAVFDKFFVECAQRLTGNPLEEWPRNWQGPNDPRSVRGIKKAPGRRRR